jgi:hypothetical protein
MSVRKMTAPLFVFAALLTAMPSSGKDEWLYA